MKKMLFIFVGTLNFLNLQAYTPGMVAGDYMSTPSRRTYNPTTSQPMIADRYIQQGNVNLGYPQQSNVRRYGNIGQ